MLIVNVAFFTAPLCFKIPVYRSTGAGGSFGAKNVGAGSVGAGSDGAGSDGAGRELGTIAVGATSVETRGVGTENDGPEEVGAIELGAIAVGTTVGNVFAEDSVIFRITAPATIDPINVTNGANPDITFNIFFF